MIKIILALIVTAVLMSTTIWECNYCRQQYIGNSPPYFVKCPARNNQTNHWWIRKTVNQSDGEY